MTAARSLATSSSSNIAVRSAPGMAQRRGADDFASGLQAGVQAQGYGDRGGLPPGCWHELNEQGAPLPFKVLKVLDRSTHGWVEFVEHLPCRDRDEARRYYERAGMLLSLFYVLEGTDCHHQNIIASGEYPVLIDAETLMHHRAPRGSPRERKRSDGGLRAARPLRVAHRAAAPLGVERGRGDGIPT